MSELKLPQALAGGFAAISKYNPHLWSAEQLRAIFVARQNELADILETLRTTPSDTVGQHALLVGTRGMGKSTLMQRLALAVEDDIALSTAWLPLRFPEEQYTVATLGQFWANVLDSLADALQRRGQATAALDADAQRIAALPVGEQTAAYLTAIDSHTTAYQLRLLLLVDNTDFLLRNLDRDAHWALRATLQSNPRLLWVGGSYQALEANSNYHDAFLDFFRVVNLRPLRLVEMEQALLALAETFGGTTARTAMQSQFTTHPERLPTLRQLSGGNPRTTVMLYELFANGQEGNVRNDLEALLDAMTPLYKSRMDALADTPRKLLAHLLEYWAPIPLGELASVSQIAKSSISPQLQRLELEGLIEKTSLHGTTRKGYQAAERFFNIWYLMRFSPRRQRTRLAWLVEFMRLWFSSDERCDLARRRIDKADAPPQSEFDLEYDYALADALDDDVPERHALLLTIRQRLLKNPALSSIFDFDGNTADFKVTNDPIRLVKARIPDAADKKKTIPRTRRGNTNTLLDLPAWDWPLATHPEERQRFLDKAAFLPSVQINQDEFLNTLAWSLSLDLNEKQRVINAIPTLSQFQCDELAKVFSEEHTKFLELQKKHHDGIAILIEKAATEWALLAWRGATQAAQGISKLIQADPLPGRWLHDELAYERVAGTLALEGHYEEAEAAYRQAIARDDKYALPWNNLGNLLQEHLGRYAEAEAAYRQTIARDDKYASPWNNLGNLLQEHLGRYDEAEAAYRQAIARDDKNAFPLANLARLMMQLGRPTEAETHFRDAAQRVKPDELQLLLQTHLFLGNRQLAMDALQALTRRAQNNDRLAFFHLKEQIRECHDIGQSERLAEWMDASPDAVFLQPFTQALYTLAGANNKLRDLPLESQQIVDEIVRMARALATHRATIHLSQRKPGPN